jgi:uncharacterized membrane protein YeiH
MLYFLDLLGTFAFAIGGAYKAKSHKLNIFGVVFLGAITAVGGGTIRDLILGRTPLFYLKDPNYLLICLIAGLATYLIPNFFKKTYSIFRLTDSVGLAAFCIIGVSISHNFLFGSLTHPTFLSSFSCIFLGMLTGFGGGLFRDTILADVPYSIKKGSNYVMSAFVGSTSFFLLLFINNYLAVAISMILTLYFREIVSNFGIYKKLVRTKR